MYLAFGALNLDLAEETDLLRKIPMFAKMETSKLKLLAFALEVADVVVGPGVLGTDQWSALELPGRSEVASADRRGSSLLWVHRRCRRWG